MAIKPIPDGFHTITPYLLVNGAAKLIDFLQRAFGATITYCSKQPNGAIMHSQLKIGDSIVMLADARTDFKQMPCSIYMYVKDADATYNSAMKAGATSIMAPADQFYGDRNAGVQDMCGNHWWIATHIKDVSEEEIQKHAVERSKKDHA